MSIPLTPLFTSPHFTGPSSIPLKQTNNNAILEGSMSMPFKPDTMTQGSSFSRERLIYANMPDKPTNKMIPGPCTVTSKKNALTNLPGVACRKNIKMVNDIEYASKQTLLAKHSGSDVIARRKAAAIGKGSGMKLPLNVHSHSFTNVNKTQVQHNVSSALRRCRNKGYVAPPKTSAIANKFKSGGGGCC